MGFLSVFIIWFDLIFIFFHFIFFVFRSKNIGLALKFHYFWRTFPQAGSDINRQTYLLVWRTGIPTWKFRSTCDCYSLDILNDNDIWSISSRIFLTFTYLAVFSQLVFPIQKTGHECRDHIMQEYINSSKNKKKKKLVSGYFHPSWGEMDQSSFAPFTIHKNVLFREIVSLPKTVKMCFVVSSSHVSCFRVARYHSSQEIQTIVWSFTTQPSKCCCVEQWFQQQHNNNNVLYCTKRECYTLTLPLVEQLCQAK